MPLGAPPTAAIVLEVQTPDEEIDVPAEDSNRWHHGDCTNKRWHVEDDKGRWLESPSVIQDALNECWKTSEKLTKFKWGRHMYTFDLQAYLQTNNYTGKERSLSYFDPDPVFIMPAEDAPIPSGSSRPEPAWKQHGVGKFDMEQFRAKTDEFEETYECKHTCLVRMTIPTADNPEAWEYCGAPCGQRIPMSMKEHSALCNCGAHDFSDKCGLEGRGMTPSPQRDADAEGEAAPDWNWRLQNQWSGSEESSQEDDRKWHRDDVAQGNDELWEVDENTTDPIPGDDRPHDSPPRPWNKPKSKSRKGKVRPRDIERARRFQASKGKSADKGASKGVFRPSKSSSSSGVWQSNTGWSAGTAAAAWSSGAWSQSTDGASTNVCACETGYSLLHALMIGVFLALVFLICWYRLKPKSKPVPVAQPKAKVELSSVTYCPESDATIYFTTSAVHRTRCFHTLETCRGLNRATSVCSAHACKICVGKKVSVFSDANFPDPQ